MKYLRNVYALLLLAAIGTSVLPIQLLHDHEQVHLHTSRDLAGTDHYSADHQAICLVCFGVAAQHYIAPCGRDLPVNSIPYFYQAILSGEGLPAFPVSVLLRGPPAC